MFLVLLLLVFSEVRQRLLHKLVADGFVVHLVVTLRRHRIKGGFVMRRIAVLYDHIFNLGQGSLLLGLGFHGEQCN